MKKYIDYEELRQILKERQIVRDTPDRRDEIGEIIFLIDNMAETNAGEELADALYDLAEKIRADIDNCSKKLSKAGLFSTETQNIAWIPVTPETMPPYENETIFFVTDRPLKVRYSRKLLVRAVCNGQEALYTAYYKEKEWYSCMNGKIEIVPQTANVTHWMYADDLMEGVEDNAEIH